MKYEDNEEPYIFVILAIVAMWLLVLPTFAQDSLMRVEPVRLEVEGIPRVAITEPQYDKAIMKMQDFAYTFEENKVLNRRLDRKDSIITTLRDELSIEKRQREIAEDQIGIRDDQITIHQNKEKVKKVSNWLERTGWFLGMVGTAWAGYEIGRTFGR